MNSRQKVHRSTRWDMAAVIIINMVNGAMFGSWYPWVPTVAHNLNLSSLHLSWALFGLPAGLATGVLSARFLINRFGPRWVLGGGVLIYSAGMVLPGLVHLPLRIADPVTLALPLVLGGALWVPGAGNGWVDPATQNLTNRLEKVTGRLLQPGLQMWLTLGGLAASTAAPLAIRRHIDPEHYLASVAGVGFVLGLVACALLIKGHRANPAATAESPRYRAGDFLRRVPLLAVCVIGVAGFMGEGVVGDWGGLFAENQAATSLQNAAWVYTTFALSEAAMRFVTERVVQRIGEHRAARVGGVIALAGGLAFISAHSFIQALAGAALLGAGIAPIVPMAFSVVGENVTAQVMVNFAGYLGVSAGPPLIGLLIQFLGWKYALGALIPLAAVVIVLAGVVRPRLPFAELKARYGTALGEACARLRVIEDAAARATERAARVADLQPTQVTVTVEDARIVVVPESAAALHRRRRNLAMLSYYEVDGHIVALEWIRAGDGPNRFVVWEVRGADRSARRFETAEPAIAAFRAALQVDWEAVWAQTIGVESDALGSHIAALSRVPRRVRRRGLRMAYREDAQQHVLVACPDATVLERGRSRRAAAWALPLPNGELLVVERIDLSRASRLTRPSRRVLPALGLLDSSDAGTDVMPFEGELDERIKDRLREFRQPSWVAPATDVSHHRR